MGEPVDGNDPRPNACPEPEGPADETSNEAIVPWPFRHGVRREHDDADANRSAEGPAPPPVEPPRRRAS